MTPMTRQDFLSLSVGDQIVSLADDGWGGHVIGGHTYVIKKIAGKGYESTVFFDGEEDYELTFGYLLLSDFALIKA